MVSIIVAYESHTSATFPPTCYTMGVARHTLKRYHLYLICLHCMALLCSLRGGFWMLIVLAPLKQNVYCTEGCKESWPWLDWKAGCSNFGYLCACKYNKTDLLFGSGSILLLLTILFQPVMPLQKHYKQWILSIYYKLRLSSAPCY